MAEAKDKASPLISITDHRALLDFLSILPSLQGKYHISGAFKKALALLHLMGI